MGFVSGLDRCGGSGSWGVLWGIIGSWGGVVSWKENEEVLWSWLKRGSCSGMSGSWDGIGSWDGVILSWHGGVLVDGVEGTASWSGGSMDANSWDGVESVRCAVHGMPWSWLGRESWDGIGGINGSWGIREWWDGEMLRSRGEEESIMSCFGGRSWDGIGGMILGDWLSSCYFLHLAMNDEK